MCTLQNPKHLFRCNWRLKGICFVFFTFNNFTVKTTCTLPVSETKRTDKTLRMLLLTPPKRRNSSHNHEDSSFSECVGGYSDFTVFCQGLFREGCLCPRPLQRAPTPATRKQAATHAAPQPRREHTSLDSLPPSPHLHPFLFPCTDVYLGSSGSGRTPLDFIST